MGLRDAHFFRKVPNDVTEATKVGGLISVLAVVTIFWLVRQEYAEFDSGRARDTGRGGLQAAEAVVSTAV